MASNRPLKTPLTAGFHFHGMMDLSHLNSDKHPYQFLETIMRKRLSSSNACLDSNQFRAGKNIHTSYFCLYQKKWFTPRIFVNPKNVGQTDKGWWKCRNDSPHPSNYQQCGQRERARFFSQGIFHMSFVMDYLLVVQFFFVFATDRILLVPLDSVKIDWKSGDWNNSTQYTMLGYF